MKKSMFLFLPASLISSDLLLFVIVRLAFCYVLLLTSIKRDNFAAEDLCYVNIRTFCSIFVLSKLLSLFQDPAVYGAALSLLHDFAKISPESYKDLVPSYVSILKQVTEKRLPLDFDYHRV